MVQNFALALAEECSSDLSGSAAIMRTPLRLRQSGGIRRQVVTRRWQSHSFPHATGCAGKTEGYCQRNGPPVPG